MAAIQLRFIINIFLAFVVCCHSHSDSASSSWAKLKISPDTISSMEYGNFLVEIYEHANNHKASTNANEKKYFYAPIALLDHKSAVGRLNRVTKQPEMRFRVEMWNDKVQNEVVKHLNKIVGHEIKSDKVRVIPLEKVIITSNTPTEDYSLSNVWTNYDKSKTIWFSLYCYDQKVCNKLANEMRSDSSQFDHLKLLYSLSSQTSFTKQTTINIDSVTSGQMFRTLLQKFGDKKEVFLIANDEKKMLTEIATNIRMDTFDDSEVGSPDTESHIYNILKDLMITSRTNIKEQSDKIWDSVFWNEDIYRPDKTTKILNEILNKLDTETQRKLTGMFQKVEKQSVIKELTSSNGVEKRREEQHRQENQSKAANETEMRILQGTDQEEHTRDQFEKLRKNYSDEHKINLKNKERTQHNYDSNSWANVDRIAVAILEKMANDSEGSSRIEFLKEDVENLLQESRNHVQWDGEKFVPKPMQLARINWSKLRDSQSFQDRKVLVRYTNAELSAPIKFVEHAELTVTDEWNNLKEELKDTRDLLVKTNAEFAYTFEWTNLELEKSRIELKKIRATVDDLSLKLNELAETKIRAEYLLTELKADSQRLDHELKVTQENLRNELRTRNSEIVDNFDTDKMPASCADLQRIGHKLSGFFSVKGSEKMEMVYCNFYRSELQKWIGYSDVKSAPVHFYVQRSSSLNTTSTPITFDLARVNEGNAMNLTSGIFTAPRPGMYFFSFSGHARLPHSSTSIVALLVIALYSNGVKIGLSYVTEDNIAPNHSGQLTPLTLQSTLNLKKGDEIWVQIFDILSGASLYDNGDGYTHFTGFVLEEEIVATF